MPSPTSRAVLTLAAALLGVVVSLPVDASDLTTPRQAERRLLGQSIDRPLAADADPQITKSLAELRGKARTQGKVRVIIGVRAAFAPEGNLSAAEVQSQRDDIANVQRRIHARLPKQAINKVTHFEFIPFTVLEVDADELDTLAAMPEVTDIQEDRLSRPMLAESVPLIRGNAAWAAGYTGGGWAVAVLDSGVDKTHPFLSAKVVSEACYSTTDSFDGSTSVCSGGVSASTATGSGMNCSLNIEGCAHGTHVAGIAAGLGTTFSGVARGANVIAVQVFSRFNNAFDCAGSAPCAMSWSSDQIKALQRVYALRTSYNIAAVNMSLGGGRYQSQSACDAANLSVKTAIDSLRSVGITTVIAAGNAGYIDSTSAPGCLSSAVIVGATFDAGGYANNGDGWSGGSSSVDEVAYFSNSASFLNLLAPGADIISAVPGGGYDSKWGTSMAAPHVAGCWAILKQARPNATIDQIEQTLKSTGVPVQDWRTGVIKSRIDCKAALDSLLGSGSSVPNLTISTFAVSPTTVSTGGAVNFTATVRNAGAGSSSATTLRYYEWLGSAWSEMMFCRTSISSLAPGATSSQSCAAIAPSIAISKSFLASVDPVFGEIITTDNSSSSIGLTVTTTSIPTYPLTVTKAGSGSGTVIGTGINCGSDCAELYSGGTFVSLTATPSANTTFTGWSGACSGGSCQLVMNGAKSVTANFALKPPNLTISAFSASPTAVSVGGSLNLLATVRNAGAGSSSATALRYYEWLSTNWSEMTFCRDSVGPLVPGATSSQSCFITPPTTAGTYYYSVAVDTVSGEIVTSDNYPPYVTVTVNSGIGSPYSRNYVQKAYVAYYGRPADPGGQGYWATRMDAEGQALNAIIGAFGYSDEFNRRYGGLSYAALVTKIYQQTLGRDPDPAGLAYYVGELQVGRRTLQSITLDVLNGATTAPDSTVVANKLDVAAYYTAKVATGCAYGTEQTGVNTLSSVTAISTTVIAAKAAIDSRCASGGTTAEGLWYGTTNSNQSIWGIVLSDGTYYVLYSQPGNNTIAGVVQGTGSVANGTFTSSNGRDFNITPAGTVFAVTLNATYVPRTSLQGTIHESGTTTSFSASYDSAYEQSASLAAAAGTYSASVASASGWQSATVTLSSTGALSGNASGCTFSGTALPHGSVNVFDVTVRFNGWPCTFGTSTLNGIAHYDAVNGQIYGAAPNASRTDGFLLMGTKP